jgi:hypothetical protein
MKISFEVWNKKWKRQATEGEVQKHVKMVPIGLGFPQRWELSSDDKDIVIDCGSIKRERAIGPKWQQRH